MVAVQGLNVSRYGSKDYNVGILKKYTDTYYKLCALKVIRKKGYEETNPSDFGKKNSVCYDEKLPESIARSRTRIFELAMCNPWEYFVTLTVDSSKCDRKNIDVYHKKLSKWLNNYNTKFDIGIKYLLIPEQHKNGAWHIHGLIMGLPQEHLTLFTVSDKIPHKMKNMIKGGRSLYNWFEYANKFGFVSMEPIRNKEHTAKYITKYMTKQANTTKIKPNDHMYYPSKGLNRAEEIHRGTIIKPFELDYTPNNDYVRIRIFTNLDEAIDHFCDDNEGTQYPSMWNEVIERPYIETKRPKARYRDEYGFMDITGIDDTDLEAIFGKTYPSGVQTSLFV